jgi:hypothetical protein
MSIIVDPARYIGHTCILGKHVWFICTGVREVNGWIVPADTMEEPFGQTKCLCGQYQWRNRTPPWILLKHVQPLWRSSMSDATKAPDFAEQISTLKRELYNAMTPCLARFKERTGVSPRNIRCDMIDTSVSGDMRSYILGDVKVEFEL